MPGNARATPGKIAGALTRRDLLFARLQRRIAAAGLFNCSPKPTWRDSQGAATGRGMRAISASAAARPAGAARTARAADADRVDMSRMYPDGGLITPDPTQVLEIDVVFFTGTPPF